MPVWWEPRPSSLRNSRAAGQITLMRQTDNILERIAKQGIVLGDGGYLIELERRGWVDSGSGREKVGTGKGSGQFTPEVAIEHPDALRELHREFRNPGKVESSRVRRTDGGHQCRCRAHCARSSGKQCPGCRLGLANATLRTGG